MVNVGAAQAKVGVGPLCTCQTAGLRRPRSEAEILGIEIAPAAGPGASLAVAGALTQELTSEERSATQPSHLEWDTLSCGGAPPCTRTRWCRARGDLRPLRVTVQLQ